MTVRDKKKVEEEFDKRGLGTTNIIGGGILGCELSEIPNFRSRFESLDMYILF